MEQLQRLAETIADTYLRDLKRDTGSNVVEYGGVRGCVERHLLASGLVDNAIYAFRDDADKERAAYNSLLDCISFIGPEYRLTEFGYEVINTMHRKALQKKSKPVVH